VVRLRADEESTAKLAPGGYSPPKAIALRAERVNGRYDGDLQSIPSEKVEYIDVSPKQNGRRLGGA